VPVNGDFDAAPDLAVASHRVATSMRRFSAAVSGGSLTTSRPESR